MFDYRKKTKTLISRAAEAMTDHIQNKLPDAKIFPKYNVSFTFPHAKISAYLIVEPDLRKMGDIRLTAGACAVGDDRMVSNYIAKGSREEMLAWLAVPENLSELYDIFEQLKQRVKQF